jgi:hypothetical protein
MPEETEKDKYKRLVICCNKKNESSPEDEDIDKKIANIKAEIKSIDKLISKNIHGTKFMINLLQSAELEESEIDLITRSTAILEEFLESNETELL